MQGTGSFWLIGRRGPQPHPIYELDKAVITIGRDAANDIVLIDSEVSRRHATLTRSEGGFILEDNGSTNGTFINDQRLIGAYPLSSGDLLGLGETVTLSYELAQAIHLPFAEVLTRTTEKTKRRPRQKTSDPVVYDLTMREAEVLALIVQGMRNQEIATRLNISLATTKSHVKNILSKLGLDSRSQVIAMALNITKLNTAG